MSGTPSTSRLKRRLKIAIAGMLAVLVALASILAEADAGSGVRPVLGAGIGLGLVVTLACFTVHLWLDRPHTSDRERSS